jgi:ATP-dependent DNA helicase RecG
VLVLTATPIPRTVAMTIFGDLDVSTIRELPGGRAGIESFVVPLADRPGWESRVWTRLGEELTKGHQAFVVCSAIDATVTVDDPEQVPDDPENEPDEGAEPRPAPRTVLEMVPLLRNHPDLKDRRIEGLHGRLSGEEKDRIMSAFASGEIDVVVATTVIEVGVDVPNASVMVVLDADRFGISQLHQLRGRVGRGAVAGLALFVTTAEEGSLARQRVDAVASTLDGFQLAQTDLELRKEGDVLGGTQSGARSGLKLLRVLTDAPLIVRAAEIAGVVIEADPELRAHPALAGAIARRLDEAERDYLSKG